MSNDIKRLLKSQTEQKQAEKLQLDLDDAAHELESYKLALAHALSQVEEMRMREHTLLGNTFERANIKPKNKSYVTVGKNIVSSSSSGCSCLVLCVCGGSLLTHFC